MKTPTFDAGRLTPERVVALRDLQQIAHAKEHRLMLIGATARLLQLDWPLNRPARRTTKDLDLLIQMRNWAEHDKLMRAATQQPDAPFDFIRQPHRLRHRRSGCDRFLFPSQLHMGQASNT